MRRFFLLIFSFLLLFTFSNFNYTTAFADENCYYLGGMPAGFTFQSKGAYVLGTIEVITENGIVSPAKNENINVGDIILEINNKEVNNSIDIENAITNNNTVTLKIKRNNEIFSKNITPVKDINGKYRLGVYVRDTINGIGTITFINNKRFASLGHPVLDENNDIIELKSGTLYDCYITGCIKGDRGKPGELKGIFTKTLAIGSADKNLKEGLYGNISDTYDVSKLTKIELGEATPGYASIFTTIEGNTPKEYKINIVKVDNDNDANKNFVIKISDKELLQNTSGIVQGMSGSPIVQNNKLVGAVTHVFINDPSRGFGISIKNMINR